MFVAEAFSEGSLPVMLVYKSIQLEVEQLLVGREELMPSTRIYQLKSVYLDDVFVKFLPKEFILISESD